ncbi:MAG: APC family permease [Microbacteriaceae bacterium]
MTSTQHAPLARRLGLTDAVFIGLGSMIGAGVFAAFTPAALAAGNGLLIGLVVAALVAFCNAASSAQLAARYPTSGGTYVYGRERLGPWWGFLAGWSFIIGKTASCAAMAMTFAAYAAPAGWEKPVAIAAVLALAGVNLRGITRTAQLTRIIVVMSLLALAIAVAAGISSGPALGVGDLNGDGTSGSLGSGSLGSGSLVSGGLYGILQSAGLLFFAFAGYARIATMGEEVREPQRTIPRAIVISLSLTIVVYAIVAITLLATLGATTLSRSDAPLFDLVDASAWAWAAPVVRVGAAAAALGALLALIAGIGRTALAMAREGDLPRALAAVHPRFHVPHRAEIVLAVVICVVIAVADLRGAIAFSSFGVLLYYFLANIAACTQPREERRYPRAIPALGAVACITLVVTLPPIGIVVGVIVVAIGVVVRLALQRKSRRGA